MFFVNKKFIGLIGCGYWGINLVSDLNYFGVLSRVSDINHKARDFVSQISKNISFSNDYKKILRDKTISSVVIDTPAKSHYKLVREALLAKKMVLWKNHCF